jgi:chemotaxis protein histidine kinase CheA
MSEIIDDQQLKEIFYKEAQGLIDEMRNDLSILREKQKSGNHIVTDDSQSEERSAILDRLFRNAHTIKSNSGIMGFEDLRQIAANLEKIFKTARDAGDTMNTAAISQLSESVEACWKLINSFYNQKDR